MIVAFIYVAMFIGAYFLADAIRKLERSSSDFTSLKTVTVGDESAVRADRIGWAMSVISMFLIWAAFTGFSLAPITAQCSSRWGAMRPRPNLT